MNEINTIFYFAHSLTFEAYLDQLNETISPRTIVFAAAQNAIYMGGVEYGAVTKLPENNPYPPYDDSEIVGDIAELERAVTSLSSTATSEAARLSDLLNTLNTTIQNRVETLFRDNAWRQGQNLSGSNFGEDEVTAYLQRLGVWELDATTNKANAIWTQISQTVNTLSATVNHLWDDNREDSISHALTAGMNAYFGRNNKGAEQVISELFAQYAKVDRNGQLINWLYSGLTNTASENYTESNLSSAYFMDDQKNAIANVHTAVTKVNDYLISEAAIEAMVDDAISGLYSKAGDGFAYTHIFAALNGKVDSQDFETLSSNVAGLIVGITGGSDPTANAGLVTSINQWKSGLISTSNLESSVVSMIAADSDNTVAASITAAVNNAGSSVTINANKINLLGETIADQITLALSPTGVGRTSGMEAAFQAKLAEMMRIIVDEEPLTPTMLELYDLNHDGQINGTDIQLLINGYNNGNVNLMGVLAATINGIMNSHGSGLQLNADNIYLGKKEDGITTKTWAEYLDVDTLVTNSISLKDPSKYVDYDLVIQAWYDFNDQTKDQLLQENINAETREAIQHMFYDEGKTLNEIASSAISVGSQAGLTAMDIIKWYLCDVSQNSSSANNINGTDLQSIINRMLAQAEMQKTQGTVAKIFAFANSEVNKKGSAAIKLDASLVDFSGGAKLNGNVSATGTIDSSGYKITNGDNGTFTGFSGVVEAGGSTYLAIAGGIIIHAGTQADCNSAYAAYTGGGA